MSEQEAIIVENATIMEHVKGDNAKEVVADDAILPPLAKEDNDDFPNVPDVPTDEQVVENEISEKVAATAATESTLPEAPNNPIPTTTTRAEVSKEETSHDDVSPKQPLGGIESSSAEPAKEEEAPTAKDSIEQDSKEKRPAVVEEDANTTDEITVEPNLPEKAYNVVHDEAKEAMDTDTKKMVETEEPAAVVLNKAKVVEAETAITKESSVEEEESIPSDETPESVEKSADKESTENVNSNFNVPETDKEPSPDDIIIPTDADDKPTASPKAQHDKPTLEEAAEPTRSNEPDTIETSLTPSDETPVEETPAAAEPIAIEISSTPSDETPVEDSPATKPIAVENADKTTTEEDIVKMGETEEPTNDLAVHEATDEPTGHHAIVEPKKVEEKAVPTDATKEAEPRQEEEEPKPPRTVDNNAATGALVPEELEEEGVAKATVTEEASDVDEAGMKEDQVKTTEETDNVEPTTSNAQTPKEESEPTNDHAVKGYMIEKEEEPAPETRAVQPSENGADRKSKEETVAAKKEPMTTTADTAAAAAAADAVVPENLDSAKSQSEPGSQAERTAEPDATEVTEKQVETTKEEEEAAEEAGTKEPTAAEKATPEEASEGDGEVKKPKPMGESGVAPVAVEVTSRTVSPTEAIESTKESATTEKQQGPKNGDDVKVTKPAVGSSDFPDDELEEDRKNDPIADAASRCLDMTGMKEVVQSVTGASTKKEGTNDAEAQAQQTASATCGACTIM